MQQLVLLQDVTKLPDASKVLLVAAFTEILHFAFTSWVGLKPEYQLLGIFQQLDICFKPKLPSLESPVLTQRLEKTTEQKTPHNLSISLFHCGILLLPDALLRYWVDGLCPYLSLHNAFQVGHTPPPMQLLNPYEALKRCSQTDQLLRRNGDPKYLNHSEKHRRHQHCLQSYITDLC